MIKSLSIQGKINAIVSFIFLMMMSVSSFITIQNEKEYVLNLAKNQVTELTDWYFDSLNTMMLTGNMSQRAILRKKILARDQVLDARVLRGDPVIQQYGPGFADEAPKDELDREALKGNAIVLVEQGENGRVLTVVTPFHATENTDGVNCLRCHDVEPGAVNGAVRLTYSLEHLDSSIANEIVNTVITSAIVFFLGIVLINIFMVRWLTRPLKNLMEIVNRRSEGDIEARVAPTGSSDEIGKLSNAFNVMADNINLVTRREHDTATDLKTKIDMLLGVVKKVTDGDFSSEIPFSGSDAVGELAGSLQVMINYIDQSIDEKKQAVNELQSKVDTLLSLVTQVSSGDLTGHIELPGDDAFAQLAEGIRSMSESLSELVGQIQNSGVKVSFAACELTGSMAKVEKNAIEQAQTTELISTTVEEISATNEDLVHTMDEVAEIAGRTTTAAMQSHAGLSNMEVLMRKIVDSSALVSEKLAILKERANNISAVVVTIAKVADQTNLLSLNAAIEAEKAGEYGRGFAVVATEIRRLADLSAVATLDIEHMIKEIQSSVAAGVEGMSDFTSQLKESVHDVHNVSKEQEDIVDQVETLGPRFDVVHQAMLFQSKGANQINEKMLQLSQFAQQTVEALKTSRENIHTLDEAAKSLNSSISQFKVDKG